MADKGDLFLDEIGNLKKSIQEKLLRALQNKGAWRPHEKLAAMRGQQAAP